jgi:hypothetical protein
MGVLVSRCSLWALCSVLGVGYETKRNVCAHAASHRLPLSPTRREEDRQDLHEADSMWSRITSVSRRGFTRI